MLFKILIYQNEKGENVAGIFAHFCPLYQILKNAHFCTKNLLMKCLGNLSNKMSPFFENKNLKLFN